MNHCYDCNSTYERPGTCNCFAYGGKRYFNPSVWSSAGTSLTVRYRTCPHCHAVYVEGIAHFCTSLPSGMWVPA